VNVTLARCMPADGGEPDRWDHEVGRRLASGVTPRVMGILIKYLSCN
jgi:hypothetical protein